MRRVLLAALAGILFGLGLAISEMTNPDKVLNFLDVGGDWDPSLALVMIGALAVALPGYRLVRRSGKPSRCGDALQVPTTNAIDAKLLAGSALFGLGWGIAGLCPGPAIANLAHGSAAAAAFVLALVGGNLAARWLVR